MSFLMGFWGLSFYLFDVIKGNVKYHLTTLSTFYLHERG